MAETWEVILWVIVAVVFFIIILVIIASVWACRRRNRRKKISRRKGLEWGKIDQTDFGKKKVQYNVERGEIKILDEADAGVGSSHEKKVEYNAKTEEATISDVVDHDIKVEKQSLEQSEPNNGDKKPVRERTKNSSFTFEESESSTSEVTKTESNGGNKNSYKVKTEISRSKNRERLQPVQTAPTQRSSNIRAVNNYTNLGYSETYHGTTQAPVVQFQQPAAIVRATVHPGSTGRVGRTKSLPRNFSKLSYKKKFSSSTTPRHKPISYNWSLEAKSSSGPQSWINVPIRIREVHHPSRRRWITHGSSETVYSSARPESEFEWDSDFNCWKYSRTLPQRRSRRSLMRRSLRKQREKRLTASQRPPPSNNICITDSQHSYTDKQRGKQVAATRRSPSNMIYITDSPPSHAGTAFRTEHYDCSLKQTNHDYQRKVHVDDLIQGSEVPCQSVTPPPDKSKRRNVGDYYEENYRMVKRSEFPRKSSSTRREVEPDMVSISGSEFSDYLTGPPRPSDSQSDDHDTWQRKMERKDHEETDSSYSHGSYKEYSGRLQKVDKEVSREEVRREQQMIDDHIRHSTTFQDTLENLRNGNGKGHYSVKHEETTTSSVAESPWQNNDSNFRKEHGVPISGVPVLPPEPVFVQTV